jgi:hypothetical protein
MREFGSYLKHPESIGSLMPQVARLLELRRALAEFLPSNLSRSCMIANYRQGKVVIFAQSGAVAAKLKLLTPSLLAHLAKRAPQVTGVVIEAQPAGPVAVPFSKAAQLSQNSAETLAQFAAELPDSALKTAIARIALRNRPGANEGK